MEPEAGAVLGRIGREAGRRIPEVDELLLPPALSPGAVRPLVGGCRLRLGGTAMGTDWSLEAVTSGSPGVDVIQAALERVFAVVIAQMSQWQPGSQIDCYNSAPAGSLVPIGPQFAIVLDCALTLARATDGAFDPALGAQAEAWGFGAGPVPAALPSPEPVASDWRTLSWSAGDGALLQPGGVALDFSGIAKGFAVDMGIAALEALGIAHALLEIGGELRGIGVRADGLPWWVDLEQPPGCEAPTARVGLTGWAVATSGDHRRRRSAEGCSWSHTLDPRTGRPLDLDASAADRRGPHKEAQSARDQVRSVTVLHRGCMQADALATALTVLGPAAGIAFADAHALPARIVTADASRTSAAWRRWLS